MSTHTGNFLTVDVEEWFHVCGVDHLAHGRWQALPSRVELTTDIVLDLLARHRITATFFVLGWIAERYPQLVGRIASGGHEIGSHGWSHRRVYELDEPSFEQEITRTNAVLEAAGAPTPVGFRAPEWSINDRSMWALAALVRHGFTYDSSMAPLRMLGNPAYPQQPHRRDTPDGSLFEFPPLVRRRFGQHVPLGGGWGLRMTRPARVVKEIERRNGQGEPVTLFLHPWELDPQPPRVALPWPLRFSHYYRLDGYATRLDEILASVQFGSIGGWVASGGRA